MPRGRSSMQCETENTNVESWYKHVEIMKWDNVNATVDWRIAQRKVNATMHWRIHSRFPKLIQCSCSRWLGGCFLWMLRMHLLLWVDLRPFTTAESFGLCVHFFLCFFHQCDPLALLVYSLVILPLTRKLKKSWKMEAELVCWCFWMSCYAYITSWMVTIFFIKDGPNNGYFFQNKKKAKSIFFLQK